MAECGPGTSPDCSERWQGVLRWQEGLHWEGPLPAQSITAVKADRLCAVGTLERFAKKWLETGWGNAARC